MRPNRRMVETGPSVSSMDALPSLPACVRLQRRGTFRFFGGWIGRGEEEDKAYCLTVSATLIEDVRGVEGDVRLHVREEWKGAPWLMARLVGTRRLEPLASTSEHFMGWVEDRKDSEPIFGWRAGMGGTHTLEAISTLGILEMDWKHGVDLPPRFRDQVSLTVDRGERFSVHCTPLGEFSKLFDGSRFEGIISNTWEGEGPAKVLMLDMKCLPGAEGSPLLNASGKVIGMMTLPLRVGGGQTEVPLALPLQTIAACMPELFGDYQGEFSTTNAKNFPSEVIKAMGSIVLIRLGETAFASGVVIGTEGWIMTSAHIFEGMEGKPHKPLQILIRIQSMKKLYAFTFTWHTGLLFWKSGPALDAALVRVMSPPSGLTSLPLLKGWEYHLGMHVYVLGHAHFGPSYCIPPSLSHGTISSVEVNSSGLPTVVQTSADIHPGCSGGALVDKHGNMVALLAGNSVYKQGHTLPHINYCIPAALLCSIVETAVSSHPQEEKLMLLSEVEMKWKEKPAIFDLQRGKLIENPAKEEKLPPLLSKFLENNPIQTQSKL